ncbi:MAG TPA: DnaJ domain-containing protein [Pseudolabrys sp.]|nr:DnaJ domain-containing protein [Pseudolabrys sp.]
MKIDSGLFDKIRVKPDKDRRPKTGGPLCQWAGCKEKATHRAPKGRDNEKDYWRFCLEHVRQYNQSYNFFKGMNDAAVMAYQKDAITGHRPTWKMGTGKARVRTDSRAFAAGGDPFGLFGEGLRAEQKARAEARPVRNAERKALDTLGLDVGATKHQVKMRFKELVKRHHPDANGGDRSTEDRLVEIIQSYNYLKSVGFG